MNTPSTSEVASIVTIFMLALNYWGVTGVDSATVTGAINGIVALASFGVAIWSWWGHRQVRVNGEEV